MRNFLFQLIFIADNLDKNYLIGLDNIRLTGQDHEEPLSCSAENS